jgi:SAM-dependent methyltransferase
MNKLARQILKRHDLSPLSERSLTLRSFFKGPLGQRLLVKEQGMLDEYLEMVFGFHLLQMSAVTDHNMTLRSKAKHKIDVSFTPVKLSGSGLCVDAFNLPFATDSVDGVVLHHILEFSISPHDILKEVRRIVRPGGDIIVIGFNPFSLFGLASLTGRFVEHDFWNNHALSVRKLVDWLTLLDISVSEVKYGYFKPPFTRDILPLMFARLESFLGSKRVTFGAGIYILIAKNEYVPVTPIKPNWRAVKPGFSGAVKGAGYCSDSIHIKKTDIN